MEKEKTMNENKQAKQHFETGTTLLNQGLYQSACEEFQKVLEIDPKNVYAHNNWGLALYNQKKYDEAIACYKNAVDIDKNYVNAHYNWGNALAAQKKYDEAIACYKNALDIDPNYVNAHYNWGLALYNQNKYDEAIACYKNALDIDPNYVNAHYNWGNALAAQKKYDEAIACYKNALDIDKHYVDAHYNWGLALYDQKKYDEAIACYKNALDIDKNCVDAHYNCGLALHNQKKYDEAIACYKNALDIDKNHVNAHNNLGSALYNQKKYDEAIACYKNALDIDKNCVDAHYNCGNALAAQKKYDEAIACYKNALDIDKNYVDAHYNCGLALYNQNKYDEAIACYKNALDIDQECAYAYHNIANCHWTQGDYKEGRKDWEKACPAYERTKQKEKEEGNAAFFQYYGSVLHEVFRDLEKSELVLQEGLTIDRNHTGILSHLLGLYLDLHDKPWNRKEVNTKKPFIYWQARESFRKAECILKERLEPHENSETLRELGALYLKMGKNDEAKYYLEKALQKDSEFLGLYVSLGVVYSRKEDFKQAILYFEGARRRDPNDLNVWSNLAEAYLKLNPKEIKQIEKAETGFRQILKIAPDHIDSQIGLGEVYTARGEAGEKDFYEVAIKYYNQAIELMEKKQGSKRLKMRESAAIYYSRGYTRVKLYEASKPFGDESILTEALQDFTRCAALDPDHYKAELARDKLDKRLTKLSRRWFAKNVAPWLVLCPSLFVLIIVQSTFFFGVPNDKISINTASYITLTFGSLVFIVVGLFLPEIQRLKGAGIELEKGTVTQISSSGSLGINK